MNARELRIGNWVTHDKKFGREFQIVVETLSTMCDDNVFSDLVLPIPLTEEWLERFGFEKDDQLYVFIFHKTVFAFDKEDNSFCFDGGEWIYDRAKYVHQLQNLIFALTGEELEIKN